jgi:hypothetical protein
MRTRTNVGAPLFSTGLQPGVVGTYAKNRFNGFPPARKPLKRLATSPDTTPG